MGEKRRRGHGEGSVYQRADGRWVAVVEYPPVMGRRRRRYCYADTRREATAALRDMQRQGGTVPRDDRQTVGAYLAAWLDGYGPSVRGNTAIRHEGAIRVHLTPRLGVEGREDVHRHALASIQARATEARPARASIGMRSRPSARLHVGCQTWRQGGAPRGVTIALRLPAIPILVLVMVKRRLTACYACGTMMADNRDGHATGATF